MYLYLQVSFWLGMFAFICRVLVMASNDWPRTRTTSLGAYIGETLLSFAFLVWAGILIWG